MARIEKNQPVMEEVGEMEKRLMGAVGKNGKSRWWRRALLVFFAIVLACTAFALWVVAAAGVARVPGFSSWAYEEPVPIRVVRPGVPLATAARERVSVSSASLTEGTLTTELRSALETSGQAVVDADRAQVAVDAGSLELYLPLRNSSQNTAFVARVRLTVEDGIPRLVADEVSLGAWSLGDWLRGRVVDQALAGALDAALAQIGDRVSITSVRAEDGVLMIGLDAPNIP